jgi:hypothetical protein
MGDHIDTTTPRSQMKLEEVHCEAANVMTCDDVRLDEAFAFVPDSKNGEPQPVYLTPYMIEAPRAPAARHPPSLSVYLLAIWALTYFARPFQ